MKQINSMHYNNTPYLSINESYTTPGAYRVCAAANRVQSGGQANASGTITVTSGGGTNQGQSCPSNATGTYPNCVCPTTSSIPYTSGPYDIKPFLYKYDVQTNSCDQWSYRVKAA